MFFHDIQYFCSLYWIACLIYSRQNLFPVLQRSQHILCTTRKTVKPAQHLPCLYGFKGAEDVEGKEEGGSAGAILRAYDVFVGKGAVLLAVHARVDHALGFQ